MGARSLHQQIDAHPHEQNMTFFKPTTIEAFRNARSAKLTIALLSHSNTVRKSIARVLTVINQKQRQNVRDLYKSKNAKC
jgi:hypothetical protein